MVNPSSDLLAKTVIKGSFSDTVLRRILRPSPACLPLIHHGKLQSLLHLAWGLKYAQA